MFPHRLPLPGPTRAPIWYGARALLCSSSCAALALGQPLEQTAPGYVRVPIVARAPAGVLLASTLGYGFTESLQDAPGSHHRVAGRLAATLTPLRGVDLTLGSNLRHDRHAAADELGADRGTVLGSDVSARVGRQLASALHLGLGASASFRGGVDVAHSLQNPTLDAQLLCAYAPSAASFSVGALAGFRYDRSASALLPPATYRAGDRLALGSSAFHAIPLGLGAELRWGPAELVAELSTDVLLGSRAPGLGESPSRLSAGVRHPLGQSFAVSWLTETALSARPPAGADDPLAPIEPRFQLLVGLTYRMLAWGDTAQPAVTSVPPPPAVSPPPAPVAAPLPPASLLVRVTTADGYPLSDATVELQRESATLPVPHLNLESYRLSEVQPGTATLRVSAPRLKSQSLSVQLESGAALELQVRLEPAPASGQLQGLIRAIGGRALAARIRIEPLGLELASDEHGSFLVDVPPGKYVVVVEAEGYESQRRHVEIGPDGVVVLNADLSRVGRR